MPNEKLAEIGREQTIMCYVAVSNEDEAIRIAQRVVEERLAACGNIIPRIRSVYRWQGKLQEDDETVLLLKTRSELVKDLMERIGQLHSYEVPGIVALPMEHVHDPYYSWLLDETKGTT